MNGTARKGNRHKSTQDRGLTDRQVVLLRIIQLGNIISFSFRNPSLCPYFLLFQEMPVPTLHCLVHRRDSINSTLMASDRRIDSVGAFRTLSTLPVEPLELLMASSHRSPASSPPLRPLCDLLDLSHTFYLPPSGILLPFRCLSPEMTFKGLTSLH